jgi:hypothetical protein
VSLTAFGRYQHKSLTDAEWLMEKDGRWDASGMGEARWYGDWLEPIEKMNCEYLAGIFRNDHEALEEREPPYAAMRRHNRGGAYDDPICGDIPVPGAWPWGVYDMPPPVGDGVFRDPLSRRILDAWKRPRMDLLPTFFLTPYGPAPNPS